MNLTKRPFVIVVFHVLCLGLTYSLRGAVFQSSVAVGPVTTYPGANYGIAAYDEPGFGGSGAGLYLSVDTHLVLRPVTGTIGIGHAWYRTFDGTVIGPAFVSSATPFAEFIGPTLDPFGQIQMTLGGSFLMGFWLDANNDATPGPNDLYGWARLSYTSANGLTLLDNAIEDSGSGIIAGTTSVVPEPSASLLLLLSLGLNFARRTARKS